MRPRRSERGRSPVLVVGEDVADLILQMNVIVDVLQSTNLAHSTLGIPTLWAAADRFHDIDSIMVSVLHLSDDVAHATVSDRAEPLVDTELFSCALLSAR